MRPHSMGLLISFLARIYYFPYLVTWCEVLLRRDELCNPRRYRRSLFIGDYNNRRLLIVVYHAKGIRQDRLREMLTALGRDLAHAVASSTKKS